ncbi:hypothetical protein EV659_103129 [Rhodothalassium salexigens DSM 2132]|uniref:Transposase n=1 Tax=Rhodothalassium salexigens DSM 2132 TaxID=1188247 RepID=A0A4R2PKX4_RHOSA|nr:hypothetical protein [Rhodothalassium salexigens]MBB4211102.1 hypothetical protein [Rhodothalassium salexigens DSM 2132]MBK1637444.1 hypothetical protein [Rhodothalassium salexigens DSM 2132]TCP36242.1 hypothetical protein EV659_103129 [Rhodothalassium salexigens DSM 2132]
MPQTVIGCDLARGWIDTHVLPSGATARIENTPEGIARWIASWGDGALVVFEATSGCDGTLIEALASRHQTVPQPRGADDPGMARLGPTARAGGAWIASMRVARDRRAGRVPGHIRDATSSTTDRAGQAQASSA